MNNELLLLGQKLLEFLVVDDRSACAAHRQENTVALRIRGGNGVEARLRSGLRAKTLSGLYGRVE